MKPRKLVLTGVIDDKILNNFIPTFLDVDHKKGDIELIISSPGGSVDVGCAMYEVLRTSQNVITTIGIGMVGSIAMLLYEAGDVRVATEGTTFLIHDFSLGMKGSLTDVKANVNNTIKDHVFYCEQIAKRAKIPVKKVLQMATKETYLTAQQAFDLKLIDGIVPYRPYAKLVKKRG